MEPAPAHHTLRQLQAASEPVAILASQAAEAESRHLHEQDKQAKKLQEAEKKLETLEKLLASSQEQLRAQRQQQQQQQENPSSSEESDVGSSSNSGDASEEDEEDSKDDDRDFVAAPGGEGDKVTCGKLATNLRIIFKK